MAIPTGTTSRQVEWFGRWVLAGMMILGMMAWWWPDYRSWGSVVAGLVLVLSLWLAARIVAGDRSVPGHPAHLVIVVPVGILIMHLGLDVVASAGGSSGRLRGDIDASMIYWLGLLSLGIVLAQSLLPRAASHVAVLGASGAAMMLGPVAAIFAGPTERVRTSLTLLGFAGVCVWLTMIWGFGPPGAGGSESGDPAGGKRHRILRGACIVVAVVAVGALAIEAPLEAMLAAGIAAVVLFVAGLVFPGRRVLLLLAGGILTIGVAAALSWAHWVRSALLELVVQIANPTAFGQGEEVLRGNYAGDTSLAVLVGMVGWVGAIWFIGGFGACVVWLLTHARRGHWGDQGRAIVWSVAAGCAVAALLAPGGLFIPAVVLAASLVIGLLPAMLGRPTRRRSGLWMLLAIGAVMILFGLTPQPGLFRWAMGRIGRSDSVLHAGFGFLTAVLLAWQMGTRRIWLGLAGIALAALLGGPAELAQLIASENRTAELRDWNHHAMGSAAAVGPYLLCMMARWRESDDARPVRRDVA